MNCPFVKKYHKCTSQGEITMDSIAAALSGISSTLLELKQEIKTQFKILSSVINTTSTGSAPPVQKLPDQLKKLDVDMSVLGQLPLSSKRLVKRLDEQLSQPEFYLNFVSALSYDGKKGLHETNTARNTLGQILSDKIAGKFTWAGQNRKDREQKYPFNALKLKNAAIDAAMLTHGRFFPEGAVSVSLNQWFSQRAAAFKASSIPKEAPVTTMTLDSDSEEEEHSGMDVDDIHSTKSSDDDNTSFASNIETDA